jgi:hypothetical protein
MDITEKLTTLAYYIIPKNGGFQVRQLTIEEDVVLEDKLLEDPDAWEQTMSTLEHELGRKFQ